MSEHALEFTTTKEQAQTLARAMADAMVQAVYIPWSEALLQELFHDRIRIELCGPFGWVMSSSIGS